MTLSEKSCNKNKPRLKAYGQSQALSRQFHLILTAVPRVGGEGQEESKGRELSEVKKLFFLFTVVQFQLSPFSPCCSPLPCPRTIPQSEVKKLAQS